MSDCFSERLVADANGAHLLCTTRIQIAAGQLPVQLEGPAHAVQSCSVDALQSGVSAALYRSRHLHVLN